MSPRAARLRKNYPTASEIFASYNPDIGTRILKRRKRLGELGTNADIPTLGLLAEAYGEDTPETWLAIQLDNLENSTTQRGMDDAQFYTIARVITGEYYWLNLAELCLFFTWLKTGKYGRFYGAVDPMRITEALRQFVKERAIDIDSVERERRRREIEARPMRDPDAISWDEYQRRRRASLPVPVRLTRTAAETLRTWSWGLPETATNREGAA